METRSAWSELVSRYRIRVVIASSTLIRAQDGLDLPATGARFLELLEPALRRDLSELDALEMTLDAAATAHQVEVSGPDETVARRLEREVRDLIWVVRECAPFAVLAR